jgi:hypothetical protein
MSTEEGRHALPLLRSPRHAGEGFAADEDSAAIRRRRVCSDCGGRFTTFERVQLRELFVVKRSGKRVPFDRDKLSARSTSRCASAMSSPSGSSAMLNGIVRQLESTGDGDIPSDTSAELVMEGLKASTTSPMCASPRSTRISARPRISRSCWANSEGRGTEPGVRRGSIPERWNNAHDRRFMAAAIRLSRKHLGLTGTNPSVGTLIVRDDGGPGIVGSGVTARGGRPHAETEALAEAGALARGATAYVTLEPCAHHGRTPPCAEALVTAGVRARRRSRCPGVGPRLRDPARGRGSPWSRACCRDEAADIMRGYLMRSVRKRPEVTLKLALSATA